MISLTRWSLAAAAIGCLTMAANSQGFCENWESYNDGDAVDGGPGGTGPTGWDGWDDVDQSGVSKITTDRANSGAVSLAVWGGGDIVHEETPPIADGQEWEGVVWKYVSTQPPDRLELADTSWVIFLSDYAHGQGNGNTWMVQIEFAGTGLWTIDAGTGGGSTNMGNIAVDQWAKVSFCADLTNDLVECFYQDVSMAPAYPISGGVFGGSTGPVQLDSWDLYSPTSLPSSRGYFDDVSLLLKGEVCETNTEKYCTAKTGLVCGTPVIEGSGISSATCPAPSAFVVSAAPARGNRSGVLLYGNTGRAGFPFQGGFLCVNPPLKRSCSTNSGGTNGACDGVFAVDMNDFHCGGCGGNPDPFLGIPGTVVNAQFWGRDSVATGSFLSNGLEWTVGP